MVGHTGVMAAAVKAVDTIDECLGRLRAALEKAGGVMLLTADHGNIEMMQDPETHEPYTAHTTLDVPIIAFGAPAGAALQNGRLADVAPTLAGSDGPPQARGDDGPFSCWCERPVRRPRRGSCLRCCWPPAPALPSLRNLSAAECTLRKVAPVRVDMIGRRRGRSLSWQRRPKPPMDLSHALPGKALAKLPSSAQQLKSLSSELKQGQPQLATAKAEKRRAGGAGGGPAARS